MFYIVTKQTEDYPVGAVLPDCNYVKNNIDNFTECDGKPFGQFPELDKILKNHGYKNIPDLTAKYLK